MLDSFDPTTGILTHCCHNPKCQYHNCKNWEPFRRCSHHDDMQHTIIPAAEMKDMLRKKGVPELVLADVNDTIVTQQSRAGRVGGSSKQHHISHPEIVWTDTDMIKLPICECGTQMSVKVSFSEDELNAPNIKIAHRDPNNPTVITHFTQHPAVERHGQLAAALISIGTTWESSPHNHTHPIPAHAAVVGNGTLSFPPIVLGDS